MNTQIVECDGKYYLRDWFFGWKYAINYKLKKGQLHYSFAFSPTNEFKCWSESYSFDSLEELESAIELTIKKLPDKKKINVIKKL
jgi:hypothetical protein